MCVCISLCVRIRTRSIFCCCLLIDTSSLRALPTDEVFDGGDNDNDGDEGDDDRAFNDEESRMNDDDDPHAHRPGDVAAVRCVRVCFVTLHIAVLTLSSVTGSVG